jgi:hypothetical protein
MVPVSYAAPHGGTSPRFCEAFAYGCGGHVSRLMKLEQGPVALFGSPSLWQLLMQAQREERTWFYGDHAYFGRKKFYRITKNAYQHDGYGDRDSTRFRAFGRPIQPWRQSGRHVLICPQSETFFGLFGIDAQVWLKHILNTLRLYTDRPCRVRWKATKTQVTPIEMDLQDCWAVVTYASASALDALIAGVPVFVLSEFAAAYRMGTADLSRIEDPVYPPDRESFLSTLANNQWTMEEIRSGQAWQTLQETKIAAHA